MNKLYKTRIQLEEGNRFTNQLISYFKPSSKTVISLIIFWDKLSQRLDGYKKNISLYVFNIKKRDCLTQKYVYMSVLWRLSAMIGEN